MELEITKGGGDRLVCGPEAKKRVKWEHLFTVPTHKKRSHYLLLLQQLLHRSHFHISLPRRRRRRSNEAPFSCCFTECGLGTKRDPFFNVAMGDNGLSGRRRRVYTRGGGGGGGGGGPGPFGDEPTQLDIWEGGGGNRMAGGRSVGPPPPLWLSCGLSVSPPFLWHSIGRKEKG